MCSFEKEISFLKNYCRFKKVREVNLENIEPNSFNDVDVNLANEDENSREIPLNDH